MDNFQKNYCITKCSASEISCFCTVHDSDRSCRLTQVCHVSLLSFRFESNVTNFDVHFLSMCQIAVIPCHLLPTPGHT